MCGLSCENASFFVVTVDIIHVQQGSPYKKRTYNNPYFPST